MFTCTKRIRSCTWNLPLVAAQLKRVELTANAVIY